jgi:hypothetical protein
MWDGMLSVRKILIQFGQSLGCADASVTPGASSALTL